MVQAINRLKVVSVEKKCVSKWLTEQLGVNTTTISKCCTNSSLLEICNLFRITGLLEVDIKDLLIRGLNNICCLKK